MKKRYLLKENIKTLALAIVAIGVMALAGCNKDEDEGPTQNILEIVESTEGLDSLAKYLGLFPTLTATLEAEGTLTLFAPTNTAFINLLNIDGFPDDIALINPDIIGNVLAYHVITTSYNAADLTAGLEIPTTSEGNEKIIINNDGTLLTGSSTSDIEVIIADIAATNGVVHTVGSVLIPPSVGQTLTPILPTTAGTLLLGKDFSILAEGIQKADIYAAENSKPTLVSILTGTTFHTVFAPTNATFDAASITAASLDGASWYGTIAHHVVLADVKATDLTGTEASTTGISFTSAAELNLFFFNAGSGAAQNGIGVFIDSNGDFNPADNSGFDAEVAAPDIVVKDNGRIHVIAGVLSPPTPQ